MAKKKHPGFAKVAAKIAKEPGYTLQEGEAAAANAARNASKTAKVKNPRLKRVKG